MNWTDGLLLYGILVLVIFVYQVIHERKNIKAIHQMLIERRKNELEAGKE